MSNDSNIEWTDATWNPVVGCTRVSAGCDNCYAVTMTRRLEGMAKAPGFGGRKQHYAGLTVLNNRGDRHFNGVVRCVADALEIPLRWKQPRRIFVNSMSDLFHKSVPFEFIDKVFAVMALCPQHTFQVLTKRPERMAEYLASTASPLDRNRWDVISEVAAHMGEIIWDARGSVVHNYYGCTVVPSGDDLKRRRVVPAWPLPNVWLGTSCESNEQRKRIWEVLKCPAATRFVSLEPLLGPVDLDEIEALCKTWRRGPTIGTYLDWVIVGGESGAKARPCNVEWIRSIVQQCKGAGVPCFVKQLGSRPEVRHPSDPREVPFYRDGGFLPPWAPEWAAAWIKKFDRKGGDPSEWPEDLCVREWPKEAPNV